MGVEEKVVLPFTIRLVHCKESHCLCSQKAYMLDVWSVLSKLRAAHKTTYHFSFSHKKEKLHGRVTEWQCGLPPC